MIRTTTSLKTATRHEALPISDLDTIVGGGQTAPETHQAPPVKSPPSQPVAIIAILIG